MRSIAIAAYGMWIFTLLAFAQQPTVDAPLEAATAILRDMQPHIREGADQACVARESGCGIEVRIGYGNNKCGTASSRNEPHCAAQSTRNIFASTYFGFLGRSSDQA